MAQKSTGSTTARLPYACRCGARWSGYNTCHCPADGCHATFTGITAFDKHRDGKHSDDSRHCVDPAKVGLVDAGRSYPCWGHTSPDDHPNPWAATNPENTDE